MVLAPCWIVAACSAHEGHTHVPAANQPTLQVTTAAPDAVTGTGDLRFRYRADLSKLPDEIGKGIAKAHGGFAKTPTGEIYFGLEGTGLVRISADLRDKTLVTDAPRLAGGALHNTTYIDADGGRLVLPDPNGGRVHIVKLNGAEVATLGRPEVNDHYTAKNEKGAPKNAYKPTDTALGSDGVLYICDGYGSGKFVLTADLTADLAAAAYGDRYFGGAVSGPGQQEGKFSTNHGVTLDPQDDTLMIADRERQWVQKLTQQGEFVSGIDMVGANPCDVDLVDFNGERLMVVGCLVGGGGAPGVVNIVRGDKVASVLKPKEDLGLELFQHIHNAAGVVVDGKLFVLCYGWNPGCYAVLEHVAQ
ncbi:NHL repeat protein [Pirellulimonas nuda]|uniref:NHL repeat protein n=2 Tax=Pirellulimonas nuda TaxID=2528009 RepID=A0A518DFN6_9BACT|nr:NHL repeat protein [Pirellulimonas nuda]